MKQLEQELVRPDLAERRDGRVMEAAIGLFEHGLEVGQAGIAFEKGTHDAVGGIGIVEAGESGDLIRREPRPSLRHQQAAVARHGGKQRALEGERGRFAAR